MAAQVAGVIIVHCVAGGAVQPPTLASFYLAHAPPRPRTHTRSMGASTHAGTCTRTCPRADLTRGARFFALRRTRGRARLAPCERPSSTLDEATLWAPSLEYTFRKGCEEIPHSWPAAPQIVISLQENGCIMASSILAGLTVASVGGPPAPRGTLATTGNVRK